MFHKFSFYNSEEGVSLIITFFILTILLAIVLGISTILYSEIKIIRNMSYSVSAYYAAESGVEKVLYYDRQVTYNGTRGLCYMCDKSDLGGVQPNGPSCRETGNADTSLYCSPCDLSKNDDAPVGTICDAAHCSDCKISFYTVMDNDAQRQYYLKEASVTPNGNLTDFFVKATGTYKNINRAIEVFSSFISQ